MKHWILSLLLIGAGPVIGYLCYQEKRDFATGIAVCLSLWFSAYILFTNSNPEE